MHVLSWHGMHVEARGEIWELVCLFPLVNINSGGQWPAPTQPFHLPYYTNGKRTLKLPKGKIALVFQRQEMTPI